MRPDTQAAPLLGLTDHRHAWRTATSRSTPPRAPAPASPTETMQFHGTADRYTLNGATRVASALHHATTAAAGPAVSLRDGRRQRRAGRGVRLRPRPLGDLDPAGQPRLGGQEARRPEPDRSHDLFFGGAAGADWVNLGKVAIPQADEQQRLLANLVDDDGRDRMPLPRFWYFPKPQGRARGHRRRPRERRHRRAGSSIHRRQRGRLLASPLGVRAVHVVRLHRHATQQRAGREFQHAGLRDRPSTSDTSCANYTPASLAQTYSTQLSASSRASTIAAGPARTARTASSGATGSQPKAELANGIRLDTNYYYWPASWIKNRPGFMTGSGMPMRFTDTDGAADRRLPGGHEMTDESDQSFPCDGQHAARPGAGRAGLLRRVHRQPAHRYERRSRTRSDGFGPARGVPRVRAPAAELDRRPQRIDVHGPGLERRHAELGRYGGVGCDRPDRHAADGVRGRPVGSRCRATAAR